MGFREWLATKKQSRLPRSLTAEYTQNFAAFDAWCSTHREHQTTAIALCNEVALGQIALPTGTGKTRVQVSLHVKDMIEHTQRGQFGCYVIASHRLALNHQLLKELTEVLVRVGVPLDLFFLGSDYYPEDAIYAKYSALGLNKETTKVRYGTQQEAVLDAYKDAMQAHRHLVCVSTYHSFHKLTKLPAIRLCTYDEAHTIASNDTFIENIQEVKKKIAKEFFFTATRRVIDEDFGMNDFAFFGPVLYEVAPRTMIEKGEIVEPKLHILTPMEEGDYSNSSMVVRSIIDAYEQHRRVVKIHSATLGAKLLITTTGNKDLLHILNDEEFRIYATQSNIHVFAFSAEHGCFVNFEKKPRGETVGIMKDMSDEEDAMLLHIDILTEGIDLPSITGVMPFRELNKTKLLQTIGRGARLLSEDRKRLYEGTLRVGEYEEFIKPFCWILLPQFFETLGDTKLMKETLRSVFNTYVVDVESFSKADRFLTIPEEDADRITQKDATNSRDEICDLLHTIEDILLESVTPAEIVKLFSTKEV